MIQIKKSSKFPNPTLIAISAEEVYSIIRDGKDEGGRGVSPSAYLIWLTAGLLNRARQVVFLR